MLVVKLLLVRLPALPSSRGWSVAGSPTPTSASWWSTRYGVKLWPPSTSTLPRWEQVEAFSFIFTTICIVDCLSNHQSYEWTHMEYVLNKKVWNNSQQLLYFKLSRIATLQIKYMHGGCKSMCTGMKATKWCAFNTKMRWRPAFCLSHHQCIPRRRSTTLWHVVPTSCSLKFVT